MPRWATAKRQFQKIVNKNGVWIQWLERLTSMTDAYDTSSETSYGYGDETVTWVTGSAKVLVEPGRDQDIVIEPGFYAEDYKKIYVAPDTVIYDKVYDADDYSEDFGDWFNIEHWEQVIFPSGSGTRYMVYPVQEWIFNDVTISKYVMIRKLLPRSGSQF